MQILLIENRNLYPQHDILFDYEKLCNTLILLKELVVQMKVVVEKYRNI